jgi:hypothetical protein
MIKNPAHYGNPFGTVAEQVERSLRQRAERAEFYNTTRETIERAVTPLDAGTLAQQIIRAGKLRRGEITNDSLAPPKGSLAEKIILAGKKRRGEI